MGTLPVRIYGLSPRRDPEPEPDHDYSSVQIAITGKPADILRKLAMAIPDGDLAPDGRELEAHCTVFYGVHFMSPSERLRDALKNFGPVEIKLGKTSLFENPDADVLKVDVESPDLQRLHKLIGRVVPTHETHPKYLPHITIAYVRSGKGKKYAGNSALVGQKLRFDSVEFSGRKGYHETLPLGHPAPAPYRVR